MNPYERIVAAAEDGRGLRLTADEVAELADDDAIRRAAEETEEAPS